MAMIACSVCGREFQPHTLHPTICVTCYRKGEASEIPVDPDVKEPEMPPDASSAGGCSCILFVTGLFCVLMAKLTTSSGPYQYDSCLLILLFIAFSIVGAISGFVGICKDNRSVPSWVGFSLSAISLIFIFIMWLLLNHPA